MKIGYQGIVGSNSEEAASKLAAKLNFTNCEFVPLISSDKVVEKLIAKEIDYGVMAIKNNQGGIVGETKDAIEGKNLKVIETIQMPIHHCMFVKNENVDLNNIHTIASHVQAIAQCERSIIDKFPICERKSVEDTAIAAIMLKDGELTENTAVICKKTAGINNGLHLIYENFEDRKDNETEFKLFQLEVIYGL